MSNRVGKAVEHLRMPERITANATPAKNVKRSELRQLPYIPIAGFSERKGASALHQARRVNAEKGF